MDAINNKNILEAAQQISKKTVWVIAINATRKFHIKEYYYGNAVLEKVIIYKNQS